MLGRENTPQGWKDRAELGLFVSDVSVSGPHPTQQNICSMPKQSRITSSVLPTAVPKGCQDRWL